MVPTLPRTRVADYSVRYVGPYVDWIGLSEEALIHSCASAVEIFCIGLNIERNQHHLRSKTVCYYGTKVCHVCG
jgi:hypothetical protein